MLNAEFYDLLMDTASAIGEAMAAVRARTPPPATPLPPLLQVRAGYAESPGWFLVQAREFDPEPLTVATLRVRDIYGSPRVVAALLEMMAGERWLERDSSEAYALTETGRTLIAQVRERQRGFLAGLAPLPAADLARVQSLLAQLIAASLESPTPPGTWCLAHSRRRAPGPAEPPLAQIHQYLDDFNAFRDDAHMAAWQPHEVPGHAWEAFAFLCEGTSPAADGVFEQLVHRGYARSEYATALADLAHRGWLARAVAGYTVTPAGQAVRGAAEALTDRYFYAPWSILTEDGIAELRSRLVRLAAGLRDLAAPPKPRRAQL